MDITVNLNSSGNITVSALDIITGGLAGITENCSDTEDLTFQMTQSLFNCNDLGANQVMLVVTDACGNSSACLATITVRDVNAPMITCPAPITINLNPGECRAFVTQRASATDNCSATITYTPDITKTFEIGTTLVTATATDAAGNSSSCSFTVTVIEYIPSIHSMACNNLINLSLDGDCKATMNADMILEGNDYRCYEKYCISVTGPNGAPHGILFGLNDVGKTFKVSITDCLGSGNSCWGYVKIEQKLIPSIECPPDVTILCSEDKDAQNNQGNLLTGEIKLMSCVPGYTVDYNDTETQFGLCHNPTARYMRTFTVYYNQTNKVSCTQKIDVLPFQLNQLVWPTDKVLNCAAVALNPSLKHPSNTGYPTVGGRIVDQISAACNLSHTYEDKELWLCGKSVEILRKWTIRNRCLPVSPNNPVEYVQIIEILDNEAPQVVCPSDITLSTNPLSCNASADLPLPAQIMDNCGAVSFKAILYGKGKLTVTGSVAGGNLRVFAENLEKGTAVVRYEFSDECNNLRVCNFNITVFDKVAPTAISKQDIVLSLIQDTEVSGNDNAHGKLFAESVDNGSHDFCSPVRLEVRRPVGPSCGNIGNAGHNNNRTYGTGAGDYNSIHDTDGGHFVKFCCEDADAIVVDANGDGILNDLDRGYNEVILRVWDDGNINGIIGDDGDNWSETWAYVKVELKAPPIVVCPAPVTVHCTTDVNIRAVATNINTVNLSLTGQPQVFGTCNPPVVTYRDVVNLNQCNIGTVTRTFTISGNNTSQTCTQTITLAPHTNEQAWIVTPPSDIAQEVSCEGPGETDIKTHGPKWVAGACDIIGLSHTIRNFDFEDGACKKWIVEYRLINWCTNEERGPYFKKFVFRDIVAPILPDCSSKMFEVDGRCEIRNLVLTKTAQDSGDCNNSGRIRWHVVVDLLADGTPDYEWSSFINSSDYNINNDSNGNGINDIYIAPTANGAQLSITLPITLRASSTHSVIWKAYDNCNNVTVCTESFMIADKKAPTPVCLPVSTALMADPDGDGPARPMIEVWASDLNFKSHDNCTDDTDLMFTFDRVSPQVANKVVFGQNINKDVAHYFDKTGCLLRFPADMNNPAQRAIVEKYRIGAENTTGNGVIQLWNPTSKSSARVWTDNILPAGNAITTLDVAMSVWDESLNTDFCLTRVRLICSSCPGAIVSDISGAVRTFNGNAVKNVEVKLHSDLPEFPMVAMTDEHGLYRFGVLEGVDYEITASRNTDYMDGVSTLDLVLIQRHILDVDKFNSPYKIIAADANNNGKVTAADITELRKLILGIATHLPGQQSWRFPIVNQPMDGQQPLPYLERIAVPALSHDMPNQNFVAVKIGDVNGNSSTGIHNPQLESRSDKVLTLLVEDVKLQTGRITEVPVYADNYTDVFGMQFTLNLKYVSFTGFKPAALAVGDYNFGIISSDKVTFSYASSNMETIPPDQILFTLYLKGEKDLTLSEGLRLSSDITKAESYITDELLVSRMNLKTKSLSDTNVPATVLFQNEPNPFRASTIFSFTLPEAMDVVFSVYDVKGKLLDFRKIVGKKGLNELVVDSDILGKTGVYYYKLETVNFADTKKMILIE